MKNSSNINRTNVKTIVLCAIFAALSCVLSPVKINIGAVPVGIVHVSIFLSAGLLGARKAALSQLVFVLIGLTGVPLFSGGLAGPTGGFILSYIGAAFVTGLIIEKFGKSKLALFSAMAAGWAVTYILGLAWLIHLTNIPLGAALLKYFVPFIVGDVVKSIVCIVLIRRLSPILRD